MSHTAYNSEQYLESYPSGIDDYFWHVARHRVVHRALRRALGAGAAGNRVLEIGCGRGIVIRYLRNHGVDCFGTELAPVDVDPDLAPYINAACDCFDLPSEVRRRVDALMLLDVIEHLPEPVSFMCRLHEAFPAARTLVITVPARTELWSSYDRHYGHFRRYTTASVSMELREAGFCAIEAGYFFHGLYPVLLALAQISGKRFTAMAAPNRRWLHRFLGKCFFAESLIVPRRLWGSSIICTARAR
jgi:SAM-dependent methyltransferase